MFCMGAKHVIKKIVYLSVFSHRDNVHSQNYSKSKKGACPIKRNESLGFFLRMDLKSISKGA